MTASLAQQIRRSSVPPAMPNDLFQRPDPIFSIVCASRNGFQLFGEFNLSCLQLGNTVPLLGIGGSIIFSGLLSSATPYPIQTPTKENNESTRAHE